MKIFPRSSLEISLTMVDIEEMIIHCLKAGWGGTRPLPEDAEHFDFSFSSSELAPLEELGCRLLVELPTPEVLRRKPGPKPKGPPAG